MKFNLNALALATLTLSAVATAAAEFDSSWESLKTYECPAWFRDAKFGIWSHWGPQAVPKQGDWYARNMYMEGSPHYLYHLKTWGHPSEHGYKDIISQWKAENWDPERLMDLYQKAGARYFVSMACHHDNFDLWDSKFHPWNSVKMGPHRDVVGEWQKAAKKRGLRFGVSEHMAASFTWWQYNRGADKQGPLAGVAYDGANPEYSSLYHPDAGPGDREWYSNNPEWHAEWDKRVRDLLDTYQPDLLYSDGGLPFGETGRKLVAHFYNSSMARSGGNNEAVYNCKSLHSRSENNQYVEGTCVHDMERGVLNSIQPLPWQTDTSIGDWFYNEHWNYRPVSWTIHMLVDIVAKNGNLLLNVVQRPDGSIDPEVEKQLHELADWNKVHGEAIYGTRPWQVYGEGRKNAAGGNFNENLFYTSKDIRFTSKGEDLYAIALGWPSNGKLTIRSLAPTEDTTVNRIDSVTLLGHDGTLQWEQTPKGLMVTLPSNRISNYTAALKIRGQKLTAQPVPVEPLEADAKGAHKLSPEDAELHGAALIIETMGGEQNIGFWHDGKDSVSWLVNLKPGTYEVKARTATTEDQASMVVECESQSVTASMPNTCGWGKFETTSMGRLEITKGGSVQVKARATQPNAWKSLNVAAFELVPVR